MAKDVCRQGIQAKFLQNHDLLQVIVERTGNKTIMESVNDRLRGTGVPLVKDGCLNKEEWISPGILGELLMEIRENQTVFPDMMHNESGSNMQSSVPPTLFGIANPLLSGVTPQKAPTMMVPERSFMHVPPETSSTNHRGTTMTSATITDSPTQCLSAT